MLAPHKHAKPDDTVLAASTVLLRELRGKRVASYDELVVALGKKTQSADYLFTPAVDLLYIVGLVEYHSTADSFEYLGT